ncbi:MAG: glycosyltransferase family 4 protein [Gammaproteobacteria bacterium]|nr:glycosyltransferase family 4 protein [Gammaproteobacteria bacterium]
MFALDEQSLARRERMWRKAQHMLGERLSVVIYRFARRLLAAVRRARAKPCSVDPELMAVLKGLPGAPGDESGARSGVAMFVARLSPGGAEKSALDLALAMAARGLPVHLFTTFGSENTWTRRALDGGVTVIDLPRCLPSACWLSYVEFYLQRRRIGVVHINNSHWMFEQARMLKERLPGLCIVSQLHAEGRAGMPDFLSLAAAADDAIDRHCVISDYLRRRLLQRFPVNPEKVAVVRTGIDVAGEFDPENYARGAWRREQGIAEDVPMVAFIGRFSDLKRPLLFLAVARIILQQRPNTRFVLKGEGPLRPAIDRALAADARLAQAVVVEDASGPVQPVMVDADLMLLTSAMEGIAYVSYEAMALGLVQVSADVGAQSELVTPDCGVLVETGEGESERFANAVIRLLDDPPLRAGMSAASRSRIDAWPSLGDTADAYQRLYAEITSVDVIEGRNTGQAHGSPRLEHTGDAS